MAENNDPLDETDKQILRILQNDSSLSNVELSEQVGLSPTPCLRRVRRLEESGYIEGYQAKVSAKKLGFPVTAFVRIRLNQQVESALSLLESAVSQRPEIINCYLITGDSDYLLEIVTPSLDDYGDLMRDHLTQIPAIQSLHSSFVLEHITKNDPIPIL